VPSEVVLRVDERVAHARETPVDHRREGIDKTEVALVRSEETAELEKDFRFGTSVRCVSDGTKLTTALH
jgi:hypothetical protein